MKKKRKKELEEEDDEKIENEKKKKKKRKSEKSSDSETDEDGEEPKKKDKEVKIGQFLNRKKNRRLYSWRFLGDYSKEFFTRTSLCKKMISNPNRSFKHCKIDLCIFLIFA